MIEEILKKYNLKYEDLKPVEKETLNTWLDALKQGQLTIEKVRDYIRTMRDSVEHELTKSSVGNKDDLFLKARLRNLMLLEAFLSTPEKAKQAINRALAGIANNKS